MCRENGIAYTCTFHSPNNITQRGDTERPYMRWSYAVFIPSLDIESSLNCGEHGFARLRTVQALSQFDSHCANFGVPRGLKPRLGNNNGIFFVIIGIRSSFDTVANHLQQYGVIRRSTSQLPRGSKSRMACGSYSMYSCLPLWRYHDAA